MKTKSKIKYLILPVSLMVGIAIITTKIFAANHTLHVDNFYIGIFYKSILATNPNNPGVCEYNKLYKKACEKLPDNIKKYCVSINIRLMSFKLTSDQSQVILVDLGGSSSSPDAPCGVPSSKPLPSSIPSHIITIQPVTSIAYGYWHIKNAYYGRKFYDNIYIILGKEKSVGKKDN